MKVCASPNPAWKPGERIAPGFSSQVAIRAGELSPADMYRLLIGTVTPRPIAFISTFLTSHRLASLTLFRVNLRVLRLQSLGARMGLAKTHTRISLIPVSS
jgi:hypothetical protein